MVEAESAERAGAIAERLAVVVRQQLGALDRPNRQLLRVEPPIAAVVGDST